MHVVLGLADRVAVLHHGQLLAVGSADEVTADDRGPAGLPGRSAVTRPSARAAVLSALTTLHVRYGGSHVLQGDLVRGARDRRHRAAGAQRRGQDDDPQGHPRPGTPDRADPPATAPTSRAGRWPASSREGVGYVPEDREVFGGLTVEENLRLVGGDVGTSTRPSWRELFPDLVDRRAQRAGTLSGGQQQMVALARVLLRDNRLLLVDEPTKGLAPKLVTEVADVLARVARDDAGPPRRAEPAAGAPHRGHGRRARRRPGRAPGTARRTWSPTRSSRASCSGWRCGGRVRG